MTKKSDEQVAKELSQTLIGALWKVKDLFPDTPNKDTRFLSIATTFLSSIITTTADLLEVNLPGSCSLLYADIEALAKNGRFLLVKDALKNGSARYSIADIGPEDFENGMNYIGTKLSETLQTSIQELPLTLRTPEMFLRGIEALLGNLLHQKFNTPNDPHKILDSLCEHVHGGLNDLSNRKTGNNVIPFNSTITVDEKPAPVAQKSKAKEKTPPTKKNEDPLSMVMRDLFGELMEDDGGFNPILSALEDNEYYDNPNKKAVKIFQTTPAEPITPPSNLKKVHTDYVQCRESLNDFLNEIHPDLLKRVQPACEELGVIDLRNGQCAIENESEMNVILDYVSLYQKEKGKRCIDHLLERHDVSHHPKKIVDAYRKARFSVLRLDKYLNHGATEVFDLITKKSFILMDNALNKAKKKDFIFICSMIEMPDFIMSTGGGVPIHMSSDGGKAVLTILNLQMTALQKSKDALTKEKMDAVKKLYGFCLRNGSMTHHTVNTVY